MKCLQIHAQRHGDGVRRADPVEFLTGETGGAHHGVVIGGGARVGEIGERRPVSVREHQTDQPIEPLMGDHHRGDAMVASPPAQRSQRESVRYLDGVRSQRLHEGGDGPRHHRAVATGEGIVERARRFARRRWQRGALAVRTGHDQEHLVPAAQYSAPSRSTAVRRPPDRGP